MMPNPRDGNCLSEDCIPFSQVTPNSNNPELESSDDKGNGRAPQTRYRGGFRTSNLRKRNSYWVPVLAVLVCLLFLLLLIFLCLWIAEKNQSQDLPCLEHRCVQAAANILDSMDETLSPCENFYEYACSRWIRHNHIPAGHNHWSMLKRLSRIGDYFMKELFENRSIENPSRGFRLSQTYYNSCMNESWINRRGYDPLYAQIRQLFGGWILLPEGHKGSRSDQGSFLQKSQFNLTQHYLPTLGIFSYTPLFQVGVGHDYRNTSHFIIELRPGFIGLQRENYVNETDPAHSELTKAYINFMRNYSLMLGIPPESLSELDGIYQFEKGIAKRTEERNERDTEKSYEVTTLQNITETCPVLEWHSMLSTLFKSINYTVAPDEQIGLADHVHFRNRCKFYQEYLSSDAGIRILHNTAVWHFLWKTVSKMPSPVLRELEEYKEADTGYKYDPERWVTCASETSTFFSVVVDRYFVKEKFDERSKAAASEMIEEIREAFKENFAHVDWMEEQDKVKAFEKVDRMKASVGYPPNINNLSLEERIYAPIKELSVDTYLENFLVCSHAQILDSLYLIILKDKDRWDLPAIMVNAFYKENANHIYFPAGILQSPVYDSKNPMALNFGGIGMVVGHEITHAFDELGSKRDPEGNLRQWWSNKTQQAFEKNSKCMIDQYSKYSVMNLSLDGKMNLGENIADNGGIKAAFKAFKKLEEKYHNSPLLPGVNLTSDQLFFISFAQIWCVKHLPRSIMNTVLFDVHTVEQYRVIGTLSNFKEFSRAFDCPLGSKMNPSKKCAIW